MDKRRTTQQEAKALDVPWLIYLRFKCNLPAFHGLRGLCRGVTAVSGVRGYRSSTVLPAIVIRSARISSAFPLWE